MKVICSSAMASRAGIAIRPPALVTSLVPSSCTFRTSRSNSSIAAHAHPLAPHNFSARAAVSTQAASQASPYSSPSAPATTTVDKDDFATDTRPVILYDGVCNLCNGAVNLMLTWDPEGRFRMAALQSQAGKRLLQRCGTSPDDISTIVVVEPGGRHYVKSEAVLRIAAGMSNPFPFLAWFGFPVPLFIRDVLYDQVANNRYNFMGKRDVCRVSDDGFRERFIAE